MRPISPVATVRAPKHGNSAQSVLCSSDDSHGEQPALQLDSWQEAVYPVRPDGYVAFADPDASTQELTQYFEVRAIHTAQR
jgi:hypothetical protein